VQCKLYLITLVVVNYHKILTISRTCR